jgi:tetratricopeptide (TPR) repeat protein
MSFSDSTHTDLTHLARLLALGRITLAEAAERWLAACANAPSAMAPFSAVCEAVGAARGRSLSEGLAAAAVAATGAGELPFARADGEPTLLSVLAEVLLPSGAERDHREALAALLEQSATVPPPLRVLLWEQLASQAVEAGDGSAAQRDAANGAALATACGLTRAAAACRLLEGGAHEALDEPEAAVDAYRIAVRLAEEASWLCGQWRAAAALALTLAEAAGGAGSGEWGPDPGPETEYWCREGLRLAGVAGKLRHVLSIDCRRTLGALLQARGACEEAATLLKEALQAARELRDRERIVHCLLPLGRAQFRLGAHQEAVNALWEAAALAEELGDEPLRWQATSGLADVRARTEALPSTRYPLLAMLRELLNDPLTVTIFDRGYHYPGVAADLTRREVRERVTRRTLCWLRSQYDRAPYEEYDLSPDEAEILLRRVLYATKAALREKPEKRQEMLQRFRLHLDREGKLSAERVRRAAATGPAEERRLWDLVYPALHERTIERAILFWLIDHGIRIYPEKTRGMLS